MNNLPTLQDEMLSLIKRKKLLIFPIAAILIFILVLIFSASSTSQTGTPQPTKTPANSQNSPTTNPLPTAYQPLKLYDPKLTWTRQPFAEKDLTGIPFEKTQLADGSTKYSYPSADPKRPNEIIVKDGFVTSQRMLTPEKYIYHYTGPLDAPDFVFQGSKYYGDNTMVYVYLNRGVAFVADSNTTLVKEQITFEPTNLEDFKKQYGVDVVDFTIIPTLAEHDQPLTPAP